MFPFIHLGTLSECADYEVEMEGKKEECKPLKDSNGSKAFGGVIAIVALITGIGAIVLPMGQRIDALEQSFQSFTTSAGTPETVASLASLQEKFVEVETQFANLDERTERIEYSSGENLLTLDRKLQIEIALNIKILEKELSWIRKEMERLGGKHP